MRRPMHRFSSLTEVQGSLCNIAARRSMVLYSKHEHDKSKVKLTVTRRHPHQHNHTSKPRDHVTQSILNVDKTQDARQRNTPLYVCGSVPCEELISWRQVAVFISWAPCTANALLRCCNPHPSAPLQQGASNHDIPTRRCFFPVFTARCYPERGTAAAGRLSVRQSVCPWRWGIVIT